MLWPFGVLWGWSSAAGAAAIDLPLAVLDASGPRLEFNDASEARYYALDQSGPRYEAVL